MQLASAELGWPRCPRCGPALPASCGSKNALFYLLLAFLVEGQMKKLPFFFFFAFNLKMHK